MLERTALNYASNATIIFQRGSVIFGDLLLAWALAVFERYHVQNNRSQTLLLLLFMPGLIIVDRNGDCSCCFFYDRYALSVQWLAHWNLCLGPACI